MHIGIDARIYGVYHRGIGRYTERLISHLSKIKDTNRYTLFMRAKDADKVDLDKGKFRIIKAEAPHYSIREHFLMQKLIRSSKVDIMHFPHLNVAYWCPVPYAVTIHDLIVYHFPDDRATNLVKWKYRLKVLGCNFILKNAVKSARRIIAVSEFTKRDIVRHLAVDGKKIDVIYLGVDKMVLGTERMRNTPQFTRMLSDKFGIKKQYLLYVGSAYPHKNLERLFRAYLILRTKRRRNWQLVLVGRVDQFYERAKAFIMSEVKEEDIRKDIIFAGEVSQSDLDGIYRAAKLLVIPSLYEGFGLPALEAAGRGTPVVCAKVASLPEVMADCAYYFDPKDVDDIARSIDAVGGLHKVHDEYAARGFNRAKLFSWDKTALQTSRLYESLARN